MVQVTVPSFAKLNLDLRVLCKRPDGYHELRTIFQTISLADRLTIGFECAKRTEIELACSADIPDNLVIRAAQCVLDHLKLTARVHFRLDKRIPLGAGLGGGSSNAAAVLLALPVLADSQIDPQNWVRMAESLGSDVPFFLQGGTAVGLGRGSEVYPLPDQPARSALVVASGIHVSTAEAYAALKRPLADPLTSLAQSPILGEFQTIAWSLHASGPEQLPLKNDFEQVVFQIHPELSAIVQKLRKLGANPALMTGSGSAIFGLFADSDQARAAADQFSPGTAFPVRFLSRRRYQRAWKLALNGKITLWEAGLPPSLNQNVGS